MEFEYLEAVSDMANLRNEAVFSKVFDILSNVGVIKSALTIETQHGDSTVNDRLNDLVAAIVEVAVMH